MKGRTIALGRINGVEAAALADPSLRVEIKAIAVVGSGSTR